MDDYTEEMIFIQNTPKGSTVIQVNDAEFLGDVIDKFATFLRASGFTYVDIEETKEGWLITRDYLRASDGDTDEFPEEAAEAEKKAYWDYMVEQAAKEFEQTFKEGDLVEIRSGADEFDDFKDYYGEVVKIEHHGVLVDWLGWDKGHDGEEEEGSTSYWWMDPKDLVKA